jgi:hypothetical protein
MNRRKIIVSAVLMVALTFVSCSARRSPTPAYGSFRVRSVNGDSILLTPPIPDGNHEYAPIAFKLKNSPAPLGLQCSAQRGPFRIEQEENNPNSVHITMPSPATWLKDLEGRSGSIGEDEVEALFTVLADLDKLREAGCFASTKPPIRDFILQSLPMKPNDSLFNYYGYLIGRSGLDLAPGMRLKIERAYFRPPEAGEEQHSVKLFLGVSTAYFSLQLASNGTIRFHREGPAKYRPASLSNRVKDGISDLSVSSIPQERHFRLLFNTYFVPEKHTRSTAIIGATYTSQLEQVDKELRVHSDEDCKNAAATFGAVCFGFLGPVTLTPQLKIELNGKTKFVDSGTRIKELLSGSQVEALKSLRIERRFLDSYYDLRFDPADLNVLSLTLVAGDRVTLSKSSRVLH